MSAAEIIEQIKQLPPEEQQVVKEFFASDQTQSLEKPFEFRYASDDAFEKAADEVFAQYDTLLRKLAQ